MKDSFDLCSEERDRLIAELSALKKSMAALVSRAAAVQISRCWRTARYDRKFGHLEAIRHAEPVTIEWLLANPERR